MGLFVVCNNLNQINNTILYMLINYLQYKYILVIFIFINLSKLKKVLKSFYQINFWLEFLFYYFLMYNLLVYLCLE
jgi:hypothetical protein